MRTGSEREEEAPPVVPWGPKGRKRDIEFANVFMEELQRNPDQRSAILAAAKRLDWHWSGQRPNGETWRRPKSDRQVLRHAKKILARGSVIDYMADIFEAIGFTPVDGARKLIDHIQGNLTKEVAQKDGTTVEVKIPPSLDALKHYHSLTLEERTKKVQVDTTMLVAHRMVGSEPPKMRARVLKNVTPELTGGK